MKMQTSFGGEWRASNWDYMPSRLDGEAFVYRDKGKWYVTIHDFSNDPCGPFDHMQEAMNYADKVLPCQKP